jgi:hypothetical protein
MENYSNIKEVKFVNFLDKNGKLLKGGARWLRQISNDGGLESHDKKVAMKAFSDFIDANPIVASTLASAKRQEMKSNLKVTKKLFNKILLFSIHLLHYLFCFTHIYQLNTFLRSCYCSINFF